MGLNRLNEMIGPNLRNSGRFRVDFGVRAALIGGMSVLPSPDQSLVRIVTLALATTIAALMLFASVLAG